MAPPARSSSAYPRTIRRVLVVAAAIAVIVFAACAPAFADDSASSGEVAIEVDTTALARVAIAQNRLDDAQRILARASAAERSDDERAAATELQAVVMRWMQLHRIVLTRGAPTKASDKQIADIEIGSGAPSRGGDAGGAGGVAGPSRNEAAAVDTWESGFAVARAQLIAGDFELAALNLTALRGAAPSRLALMRSRGLGLLANELVAKHVSLAWPEALPPVADGAETSPDAPDYHRDPKAKRRWYGWQTLLADGTSLIVVPLIGTRLDKSSDGTGFAVAIAGSYLLAPAVIHIAHGHPGKAAASIGLRLGIPLTGALLGYAAEGSGNGRYDSAAGAAVGLALGVLGASALDAALLAREPVADDASPKAPADGTTEPSEAKRRAPRRSAITFTPVGGPRREGGFDVGVGAIF